MAKLVSSLSAFLILAVTFGASAKTMKLELYGQTSLEPKLTLNKEAVGGLSGVFLDGSKLIAVSDDRGKAGPPRFYELTLKITDKVEMILGKAQHFTATPAGWVLDIESVALLAGGDFLLSSEGDNNKKPRAMPRLFVTSSSGVYKSEISIPDKYLPDAIGLQKKGIENNMAFEGITVHPGTQNFFAMNEYSIIQDQSKDDDQKAWLRIIEFTKDKDQYKVKAEYPYMVTRLPKNATGIEVFRGVSEILTTSDSRMIVLERGARLTKSGVAYSGGLYITDLAGAADVSAVANLSEGKSPALKKELLVDLEELFKNQKVENFEALAWGPNLADGRKTLLVLSDNNFSAKEKTTLLVFAVNEVE
ncbi:esterase-like activity of phytase family protein [Bdellovibrio sp. HCB337]|uniref:esterase-like activity of phytase family protein n=1 Tax=Bdellovibrio sp. HCB337 TaxID=3394358 RepID=UPI0039A6880C